VKLVVRNNCLIDGLTARFPSTTAFQTACERAIVRTAMTAETAFRSDEHFTQDEFRRWLDDRPQSDINHYELINGRIVMTPPAGWPHGRVGVTLSCRLNQHVSSRKLGMVLDSSTGYDLPSGDTVEPDVSFITSKRFAAGPPPVEGQFLRIVPTLALETLSRSTARRDRTEKKKVYERNGVDEYWIVDAPRRRVTVFHLGKRGYDAGRTFSAGKIKSRPLPKLDLSVEDVFAF
jgi:Uma2 family endonuclease